MQKVILITAVLAMCLVHVGCIESPLRLKGRGAGHMNETTLANEAGRSGRDTVPKAMEWSKKYAVLADKCLALQQENTKLSGNNRQLAAQLEKLKVEMSQATKELADANSMLGDLDKELAKWKHDVLGFRNEMRKAQQAQLKMLSRMIVLMGGEAPQMTTSADGKLAAKTK